ncbi:gluconate 2-dehydrogenase subunit 3 family protein [Flavitalea sp.]|nr:gluconate 2-dehydrogenase subunit 3 family protein [Flavitalea sp.]
MNRRESLKAIGIGTLATGVLLEACKPGSKDDKLSATPVKERPDRLPEEIEREKKLMAETFFTPHEMATITILADIIIPRDEHSGSASDAKVPDFIEFIVKDKPEQQVPMRGGLRWLDLQCFKKYNNPFVNCDSKQQLEIVDQIAYPGTSDPAMQPGEAFFDRLRNLTATGFFTSKIGIADLGYLGNRPNKWEGVPADVIKQYGLEDVTF